MFHIAGDWPAVTSSLSRWSRMAVYLCVSDACPVPASLEDRFVEYLSFEKFAEVVRDYGSMKSGRPLFPQLQLQRDLGMNEDRCSALMKALEIHYGITFTPESFDLRSNERLFRSADVDEEPYIQTVFGITSEEIRPLTLGQLCRAVLKELGRQQAMEKPRIAE